MSCCEGCCKGTCSCCCCGDGKNPKVEYEHLVDGNIFNNRSCTDCLMIPLYVIMVAGWVVLLIVASQLGHPERILYASNFRGTTCGNSDIPAVADRPNYWVPIPTLPTYGYCTDACPSVGDVACNNDVEPMIGNASISVPNTYYNHKTSEFIAGAKMTAQCAASSCTAAEQEVADRFVGLQFRMKESKCFMAMYSSQPAVYRCVPFEVDVNMNMTLMEAVNASASQLTDLTDTLGVTGFFQLGFGEVMQCWRVILICMFTACAVAAVWVLLLRWILAPMVYICLILVLGVLLGIGFVARKLSQDITALNLPGDSGTGNHGQLYTVVMWVAFVGAGVYFVVALWLLNRIRIAIAVMKEASKAFLSAPSLIFVPPIIFVLLIGWLAFFVVTTIYIQTMGDLSTDTVGAIVGDLVGETVVNVSAYVASSANAALQEYTGENASMLLANATSFNATAGIKGLHAYNFFMVLWTSNMFIMLGFFAMSMTIVSWYFSTAEGLARSAEAAVEDGTAVAATSELPKPKDKYVVVGAVCRSLCAVIRNHLGTVLWGALLIAIIQFIRAVFIYLQETVLKDMKDTTSGKVVLCIVNCCLWYIEKIVRVISKNAFIITSIKNVSFCSAAVEAVGLLLTNGLRFSVLLSLSTATLFVVKVFIVGCNALIAYGLMQQKSLTDDRAVESGLFPYFGIVLATFAIASLFLNVYEACIDTIFLCFLVDETDYQGLFMPESLAELVGLFAGAEEARKQYEAAVAAASRKSADIKAPRPSS